MTTDEQRRQALVGANARRLAHAAIRRHLQSLPSADSRLEAAEMFRHPAEETEHMKARYVLESIYRFGPVRVGRLIRKTGFAPGRLERKLVDLTEHERGIIADHLLNPHRAVAVRPEFTEAELTLIGQMSQAVAERTFHAEQAKRLERIAEKCG